MNGGNSNVSLIGGSNPKICHDVVLVNLILLCADPAFFFRVTCNLAAGAGIDAITGC
jgi:hypothetical protein